MRTLFFFFLLLLCGTSFGATEEVDVYTWEFNSAQFTFEARQFEDDGIEGTFENQRSLLTRLDLERPINNGLIKFIMAGRYDDQDPNRNIIWAEDVFLEKEFKGGNQLKIGYQVFNFAAMESFNPLDAINARIFDVSIVDAEKLGELSLGLSTPSLGGYLSFYLLPNPTKPILPGKNSRINLEQNLNVPVWMGSKDDEPEWDDHFLLTWEGMAYDWDVLVMLSKTIDRSRNIVGTDDYNITLGSAVPNTTDFATPYYFERYLSGLNLVGNWGDDLLKLSLAYSYYLSETEIYTARQALESSTDPNDLVTPEDYSTMAVGYEHPFSHSNGLTSSLILEYQRMYFAGGENTASFPLDNDIFLAWRLNFNDLDSKVLTLSALYDATGRDEGFAQIDYSQRLNEVFRFNIGILDYFIPEDAAVAGYGLLQGTEHAYIRFSYYL